MNLLKFLLIAPFLIAHLLHAFPLEKTQIILVITDDQGYGSIGKHGNPWIKLNLEALWPEYPLREIWSQPTCSPTRAVYVSRHPMKNGITHTILERERMALSTVTLPQVLKMPIYLLDFWKMALRGRRRYQPIGADLMKPLSMVPAESGKLKCPCGCPRQ